MRRWPVSRSSPKRGPGRPRKPRRGGAPDRPAYAPRVVTALGNAVPSPTSITLLTRFGNILSGLGELNEKLEAFASKLDYSPSGTSQTAGGSQGSIETMTSTAEDFLAAAHNRLDAIASRF